MSSSKNVIANFIPTNPSILASVTVRAAGVGVNERDYTLQLSNVGIGPGSACQITSASTQLLTGSGALPTMLTSLPLSYGTIAAGASSSQIVAMTVAPTISRFLLTINGSCNNAVGTAIPLTTTLAVFR
jgi:hypothetical protein